MVNHLSVHGRTCLQKYAFLASELYRHDLDSLDFYRDWKPHNYGPYSRSLDLDVRQCVRDGILDETDGLESDGHVYYVYTLKPKGLAMLRKLALEHEPLIKTLHAKFSDFNKKPWKSLLKDIYEAYPGYTTNSLIKDEVVGTSNGADDDTEYEPNLNPEIERALEDIELGRFGGTTYTIEEYIKHVQKVFEE